MTKKALADFLIGRGFDILAVLRLCRYPALKSFIINCPSNAFPAVICDEYGALVDVEPSNGHYSVTLAAETRCIRIAIAQNLTQDESPSDAQIEGVFNGRRVAAKNSIPKLPGRGTLALPAFIGILQGAVAGFLKRLGRSPCQIRVDAGGNIYGQDNLTDA